MKERTGWVNILASWHLAQMRRGRQAASVGTWGDEYIGGKPGRPELKYYYYSKTSRGPGRVAGCSATLQFYQYCH